MTKTAEPRRDKILKDQKPRRETLLKKLGTYIDKWVEETFTLLPPIEFDFGVATLYWERVYEDCISDGKTKAQAHAEADDMYLTILFHRALAFRDNGERFFYEAGELEKENKELKMDEYYAAVAAENAEAAAPETMKQAKPRC